MGAPREGARCTAFPLPGVLELPLRERVQELNVVDALELDAARRLERELARRRDALVDERGDERRRSSVVDSTERAWPTAWRQAGPRVRIGP
jgi:hypothetical protein